MAGLSPSDDRLEILLSCYLDGELTDAELDQVVRALEHDRDTIAEFRRLQQARRALRTLPLLNPPTGLAAGGHLGEELSAYLDGELAGAELRSVLRHLDDCSDCRSELADLDRSRTAVRALPGIEPPEFLSDRRIEHERRTRRLAWPAAAVAGGMAAAALAFTIGAANGGPEPASIDIADLETRHAAVASVPSEGTAFEVSSP